MSGKNKGGLGRGYSAIFEEFRDYEDNRKVEVQDQVQEIEITLLDRNPEQARKTFDEESLKEMAESMRLYGVLQPLLVVDTKNGRYKIIAGERRFRASLIAGLKKVPVIIKDLSEQEIKEISLIENLQREDLNAIEAAEGIKELMEIHSLTQEEVAKRLGKSRPYIANTLRLLTLPDEVLEMVKRGELTPGHARALITIEDKDFLINLARQAVKCKWTVREIEEKVRLYYARKNIPAGPRKKDISLELKELVTDMKRVFGTRVKLTGNEEKGRFVIDYFSRDDLERIYALVQSLKDEKKH
ncbi:MAG: ParB/RepB/Spo0J family partition protein [Clostridiales bacterium]|nr:ParB/RepB/Spo0J family partition protein [Clostridiales bacterium]